MSVSITFVEGANTRERISPFLNSKFILATPVVRAIIAPGPAVRISVFRVDVHYG